MSGEPERCRLFDSEGVLLEEAGASLAEHVAGCAFCQQDQRRVAAVREELGRIPLPPAAGHWEQAVFARIAANEAASSRRRRWLVVVPFMAAAAAVALFLFRPPSERPGAVPVLALRFERGAEQLRAGDQPTKGATLVVSASSLGGAYRELRIYREDVGLVVQCSDQPPCTRQPTGLGARWTIPAIGRYRVLLATSPTPLPVTAGKYEPDAVALRKAGSALLEELVEVW